MESPDEHNEMLRLLRENNELLKKLYRHNIIGLAFRVTWYVLLLGLPFALYFYIFEPYFTALGSDYELFKQGISEVPGFKAFLHILPQVGE